MPRSHKVSPERIDKVKLAVKRNGYPSQKARPEDVEISRLYRLFMFDAEHIRVEIGNNLFTTQR
jgi:hypothetical protein